MPRQALFTKEEMVAKALQIVRENGVEALSARSLGAALGSSSRPIFTVFRNMEEVEVEVRTAARGLALMNNKEKEVYTERLVSDLISMQFVSTLNFIRSGKQLPDITPHLRREGEKTTVDFDR